jgi:molybdate transport repressor ModE-like protein
MLVTETGGAAGGGAQLTDVATRLLKTYRTIEKNAASAVDDEIRSLSSLVQQDAAPRSKSRRI